MLPCRGHILAAPLAVWTLLQLTVRLEQASCDTAGNSDNDGDSEIGSCFRERREQGNCFGLLSKTWSKMECCKNNGFFVNRLISETEYLNDHLLFSSGTPFCIDACYEDITPTCLEYRCAHGHTCRMINNRPKCVCQLSCNSTDYHSGPVCSNDLRRFNNQCLFKRAVCLSPMESLHEVPCPKEVTVCAPDSVLPGQCVDMLQALKSREKRMPEENPDAYTEPWLLGELGRQLYNLGLGLFNTPSQTVRMHRRSYFVPPTTTGQHRGQSKRADSSELQMSNRFRQSPSKQGNWKHCPAGEYCLIRQYDSRPSCIPLALTESVFLNDCPEEGVFPEPMCGVDNQTYANACQLRSASLKKQMEVRIAYRGSCRKDANCSTVRCLRDGMTCRPHHKTQQPVCLDCDDLPQNCNAYARYGGEELSEAREKRPQGVAGYLGDPKWSAATMTSDWPAVCGSNGRTYANSCFLHIFNCYSPVFVDLSMPGLCQGHV